MRAEFVLAAILGGLGVGCNDLIWMADGTVHVPDDAAPATASPSDGGSPISTAPDVWVPTSDCGGVGNLCSMNCGTAGQCQAGLDVCVPAPGPHGYPGQSVQTPYCLAATCMTYEQASCFCKGAAGAQFTACGLGPGAVVGLCGTEGTSCANKACCGGLKCVMDSPDSGTCYTSCQTNNDCSTGCCTDLKSTGDLECAPASACQSPCTPTGGACGGSAHCCTGTCVTSTTNPDFMGCRPTCSTNADCLSNCCQPFSNSSGGFCVDASYCGCTPTGGDCTHNNSCCAGNTCGMVGSNSSQFICYKNCMGALDCDGGCCTTNLPSKNYGLCALTCP